MSSSSLQRPLSDVLSRTSFLGRPFSEHPVQVSTVGLHPSLPAGLLAAFAVGALLTGCGGDGGTNPDPGPGPGPTPTISISVDPGTLSLEQGTDGTLTVTLTRGGGYAGAVTLTLSGLPSGVVAGGLAIPAGSSQAQLTLNAGGGAAIGGATITVAAAGSGVAGAQASFALQVTAAPVGSFALSIAPAALSLQQGTGGSVAVAIDRAGGFAGAVSFSVAGAPAGLDATLADNPVAGTGTTLQIAAQAALTPATYTLVLTASGAGTDDRTATLEVTVTGAALPVRWEVCEAEAPIWFAVQDGNGPWQRVPLSGGAYSFDLVSERGAVAFVTEPDAGGDLSVFAAYLARADFGSEGIPLLPRECVVGQKVVRVAVSPALAGNEYGLASLGGSTVSSTGNPLTLELDEVSGGPLDLVGARGTFDGSGPHNAQRMFVQRGIEPANQSTIGMDLSGPFSFNPVQAQITLFNLSGGQASLSVQFVTERTSAYLFESLLDPSAAHTVALVPEARQISTDLMVVEASTFDGSTAPGTGYRTASRTFHGEGDQSVTFGPVLSGASVEVAATQPMMLARFRYMVQPEYDDFIVAGFEQQVGPRLIAQGMILTGAWMTGNDLDVTFPDLSGTDGWQSAWNLTPGLPLDTNVAAFGGSGTGLISPFGTRREGELRSAVIFGRINP